MLKRVLKIIFNSLQDQTTKQKIYFCVNFLQKMFYKSLTNLDQTHIIYICKGLKLQLYVFKTPISWLYKYT